VHPFPLFTVLLIAAQANAQAVPDALLGSWAGAMVEKGTPLLFELKFQRAPDDGLSAELMLPYNG